MVGNAMAAIAFQMCHLTAGKAVQMKMRVTVPTAADVLIDKAAFPCADGEFFDRALIAKRAKHTVDRAASGRVLGIGGAVTAKPCIDLLGALRRVMLGLL